tara:strand:- start:1401 stop:1949 length:549 start_codon:yes stop_codon:yes gene_type:complete
MSNIYKNLKTSNSLMNRIVLVLNADYSPMSICTTQRAICMSFLKKIDILESYNEKVKSPSISLKLPSVVKVKWYIRYKNLAIELNRKNILSRDEFTCQYCSTIKEPLTIDHVKPKVRGGLDIWENLVTACKPCNQKKGDRTPELANMPLIKEPKRPNRIHYFQKFAKDQQNAWRPYVFMESF